MPSWKKLIISGSDASLNSLISPKLTGSLHGNADTATTASYALNIGGVSGYKHTQSISSATWTVTHNLGTLTPLITVYDANYDVILPNTITSQNSNETTIGFTYSTTGYVVVSAGEGYSQNTLETASYALKSETADTASYTLSSVSSSYALTASYALNGGGGGTSETASLAVAAESIVSNSDALTLKWLGENNPSVTSSYNNINISSGSLNGSATYNSSNNIVVLTTNTNNQVGSTYWETSTLDSTKDIFIRGQFASGGGSGADGVQFNIGSDDKDNWGIASKGISVVFDEYNDKVKLGFKGITLFTETQASLDNPLGNEFELIISFIPSPGIYLSYNSWSYKFQLNKGTINKSGRTSVNWGNSVGNYVNVTGANGALNNYHTVSNLLILNDSFIKQGIISI